ncbi:unnamed protein product [Calypogeia fissa]
MASKPPPPISSSLNPNAPVFVPAAYQAAEDFSPEWWHLIQSSTSFREWWMKERFVSEENEQAAAVAARKEEHDFDDIDELLELGFQSGILDDLEDQPSPVAVPHHQQQQHHHHVPYQHRQPYYQQQQQPLQQQQVQPLQNENLNYLISPAHSFQKFRYGDGAGAGGAQLYRGTALKEGKPL